MRGLITTVAGALLLLALAAPAGAKVLGHQGSLTYVKKSGTLPAAPSQNGEASVDCPSDTQHTGGGASATGPPADTYLATNGAISDDGWSVDGWHDQVDEKKKITAWGICSSRPAKISENSVNFPAAAAPASANGTIECNNGHAVGGGAILSGAAGDWQLNSTFPIESSDSWRVFAQHHAGSAVMQSEVFVVCMEGQAPRYVSDEGTTNADKTKRKATCRTSEAVTGGGAFVTGDTADAHITSTAPIDTRADKDKVPDNGWRAKFYNSGGNTENFVAWAICK